MGYKGGIMKPLVKRMSLISLICILLMSTFLLSACGSKQITIEQIYDKLSSDYTCVEYTTDAEKISEQTSKWKYSLEKQNVNSEHLMIVAVFNYYSSSSEIDILKFSKDKYAKKMIENYNFENDVKAKRYGNLIVIVDNQIE